MSRCWIRVLNGVLLPCRRRPQEAALVCLHRIRFMIKGYPQPLVRLIEMRLAESFLYLQGCRCGVLGSGKFEVAFTHLLIVTLLKQWLNLTVYVAKSLSHLPLKKKQH